MSVGFGDSHLSLMVAELLVPVGENTNAQPINVAAKPTRKLSASLVELRSSDQ